MTQNSVSMPRWSISSLLRPHHVGDGDDRESQAPGLAGGGSRSRGPVEPMQPPSTLAQIEKIALGIEHLARPHQHVPPAGLAGDRMRLGDILVAGQGMADQDCVGAVGVEAAIGLISDGVGREADAGVQRQRLRDRKAKARPPILPRQMRRQGHHRWRRKYRHASRTKGLRCGAYLGSLGLPVNVFFALSMLAE